MKLVIWIAVGFLIFETFGPGWTWVYGGVMSAFLLIHIIIDAIVQLTQCREDE